MEKETIEILQLFLELYGLGNCRCPMNKVISTCPVHGDGTYPAFQYQEISKALERERNKCSKLTVPGESE